MLKQKTSLKCKMPLKAYKPLRAKKGFKPHQIPLTTQTPLKSKRRASHAKIKDNITPKTSIEVLKRCKSHCEGCGKNMEGTLHHIFFKSQYFGKDRNLSWNLSNLCQYCHRILHHSSTDKEVEEKNKLDYKLKNQAMGRYYGKNKPPLLQLVKIAFIKQDL